MNKYQPLSTSIAILSPARLPFANACEESFKDMNSWLREISMTYNGTESSVLIGGALSASIEVASTAYLGLVKQSIASLRVYYELSLAWLYYKDHPVEWARVVINNDQASLPGEIQKYLKNYFTQYEARWSILEKKKARAWDEPYKIMSSFVHGNMLTTLPAAKEPREIIANDGVVQQLPKFISSVCEYISDAYVCSTVRNWESLPASVRSGLEARIGKSAKLSLDFA